MNSLICSVRGLAGSMRDHFAKELDCFFHSPRGDRAHVQLQRYYEPLRHPKAPGLSLAGFRLVVALTTPWGFPCCVRFVVYMLPPLPRRSAWTYCFRSVTQPCQPSPKGLSGRPAHRPFRGLLSVHSRCGLHTRAVTNSWHAFRRLQPVRYLLGCSGCFRLERSPGGTCTYSKAPPCHGAHPKQA